MFRSLFLSLLLASAGATLANADDGDRHIRNLDIFDLEWALNPQISPDGRQVLYTRLSMDIMKDRPVSHVWIIDADGGNHRPVLSGTASYSNVRWSPDGTRIAYVSSADARGAEQGAQLVNVEAAPHITEAQGAGQGGRAKAKGGARRVLSRDDVTRVR